MISWLRPLRGLKVWGLGASQPLLAILTRTKDLISLNWFLICKVSIIYLLHGVLKG